VPTRRATGLTAAALATVCLLAACTGSAPKHATGHATGPQFGRHTRLLPRPIVFPGGGGVVEFIGGGTGAASRPKISLPPIPAANSSLPIAMPLEAYQAIATQQQEALAAASDLLTQRCMAARGFDDSNAASEPFTSVASLVEIETGVAGLVSLPQARTFGFARPKGTASSGPAGPAILGIVGVGTFGQALKAGRAYTEALYGFAPGMIGPGPAGHMGCLQLATQDVYGPRLGEPVPDPVPEIAQQALGFTEQDPRVHAVQRAWSKCIARHYYHYTTPSQVEAHNWPTLPDKAEIRTAVADVKCKIQTNLLNTMLTVEAAYQQALIVRNLAALSQLQANFAPLLRRAQAALAAPT